MNAINDQESVTIVATDCAVKCMRRDMVVMDRWEELGADVQTAHFGQVTTAQLQVKRTRLCEHYIYDTAITVLFKKLLRLKN